jgi:hypothetical protein
MNRNILIYICLFTSIFACNFAQAGALERYAGTWLIEKSEPAPWAKTADMIEAKEVKRLTGTKVEFKSDRIVGAEPLGCKGPNYELKQYGADDLFQGALAEYGDPSTTPDAMAAKLGFARRPIPSLVTGCVAEIEFHELDTDHLAFALNNSIYRLTRQAAATPK